MAEIKLPLDAAIVNTHELHGKFAISNEHGLVLIGFYPNAGEEHLHAIEFHLDGEHQFKMEHMPGKDGAGWPRYFDQGFALDVRRVAVTMLDAGKFQNGATVEAGDLFVYDGSTYLIGQPEDPRQGNGINLDTKAVRHISHGDGYVVKKWRIDAYGPHDQIVLSFGVS